MVVTDVWGGSGKRGRRSRDTQASAMACQRELGPEQRRHREEDGALEPVPVAKTGHDLSLPLTRFDATDPDQPLARPGACSGAVALGVAGTAVNMARRSASATDRKSQRPNSRHQSASRMPPSDRKKTAILPSTTTELDPT